MMNSLQLRGRINAYGLPVIEIESPYGGRLELSFKTIPDLMTWYNICGGIRQIMDILYAKGHVPQHELDAVHEVFNRLQPQSGLLEPHP